MALKQLRDRMKYLAWTLWLVIIAFVFAMFFEYGSVQSLGGDSNEAAATVGSEKITFAEFRTEYQNLEARYRQLFGDQYNSDLAQQFNLPRQAIDQLINRRILLMEARNIGLRATDEEVQKAILELPFFQDEAGEFIGREKVVQALQNARLEQKDFEKSVRDDLLVQKLNSVLASTSFISEEDVEKAYRNEAERAKIRFVNLPASEFAGQVDVAPAKLQSYFEENAADYELPEQRVAQYMLVNTAKLRQEIELPDEEMQAYYDSNQEEYTREEQVRARHILLRETPERDDAATRDAVQALKARIAGGEDFATLARETSADESSAQRGGNLGFFTRDKMVKPFSDAAFAAEPGTLVGPVKSDFGYHLIDVQEHREGGLQPFEQVKNIIRSRIIGERVLEIGETKARDIAQRINSENLNSADQLQALAEEEGLTLETTPPFGLGDSVTGIGRVTEFNDLVFGLEPGNFGEPVKVPRGWIVAKLEEIKEPRIPELSEVEAQVRQAVALVAQKEAAVEKLRSVRDELANSSRTFEQVAEGLGLELQESAEFGRFGNITGLGSQTEVINAALELETGNFSEAMASSDGAVLFEVLERKKFDAAEFEEQKTTTRTAEAEKRMNQLLTSLIELRRRDQVPVYHKELAANFGIQADA